MRTIKFRGQRLDNNEWVYGCIGYGFNQSIQYIMPKMYFATRDFGEVDENGEMIIEDEIAIGGFIPVKPETVGQFTGLPCRNEDGSSGELFEGDIVRDYMDEVVGVIDWYYDMWVVKVDLPCKYKRIGSWDDWVKIGNEFDNPELLTKN